MSETSIGSGLRNSVSGPVPTWFVFILFSVVGAMSTWGLTRATATSDSVIDLRVRVSVVESARDSDQKESERRFCSMENQLNEMNKKLDRLIDQRREFK